MGRRRRRNNRTSCFDEQFDVEEVVDKKTENGKIMYFVKWRGYPPYDNSWVAQEDCHCASLIEEYEERMRQATSTVDNPSSSSLTTVSQTSSTSSANVEEASSIQPKDAEARNEVVNILDSASSCLTVSPVFSTHTERELSVVPSTPMASTSMASTSMASTSMSSTSMSSMSSTSTSSTSTSSTSTSSTSKASTSKASTSMAATTSQAAGRKVEGRKMIHRVETDTIVDDGKTIRSILGVKHNNGRYEAMVVYENNKCEHLSTELMTKYPAAALKLVRYYEHCIYKKGKKELKSRNLVWKFQKKGKGCLKKKKQAEKVEEEKSNDV